MKAKTYVITTMTNMHVGSGEYNIGVVDNLVQRDVLTDYPNIDSSSLKGALREYFDSLSFENKDAFVRTVFGSSPKEKDSDTENNDKSGSVDQSKEKKVESGKGMKQGAFRFFEAHLLSFPVRSDKAAYLRAVTPSVIKELIQQLSDFGISLKDEKLNNALNKLSSVTIKPGKPIVFQKSLNGAIVEDFYLKAHCPMDNEPKILDQDSVNALNNFFGKDFVLMNTEDFANLCDTDHLPIMARNCLESGESKNLWYEEVVPRYAQFSFMVMVDSVNNEEIFDRELKDRVIQIGANATIGYGYTKIEPLSTKK